MQRSTRFNTTYIGLALLLILLMQGTWSQMRSARTITYSEFQTLLEAKQVSEVFITRDRVSGTLTTAVEGSDRFVTNRVEPELAAQLEEHGVEYSQRRENTMFSTMLS